MTGKYINNTTYAITGYTLSGANEAITIGPQGVIGGIGIVSGTRESYAISNRGTVSGYNSGIYLKAGGTITNSGAAALIEGQGSRGSGEGVVIAGGVGAVLNTGTILGERYAGVSLTSGGTVTNSGTSATIEGNGFEGGAIGVAGGAGLIDNTGTVLAARFSNGVYLAEGGSVSNGGTAALIEAFSTGIGVSIAGGGGTVGNTGTIEAGLKDSFTYYGIGVALTAGGSVSNTGATALIHGGYQGILVGGGIGIISNGGRIIANGRSAMGIYLKSGGSVTNSTRDAVIAGVAQGSSTDTENWGVLIRGAPGTVINDGTILAGGTILQDGSAGAGVYLAAGGIVTNLGAGALIEGYTGVVIARDTIGTVITSGTIASAEGASGTALQFMSYQFALSSDVLIVDSGARFIGTIKGGGGTLELAGKSGTLSGLGTSFVSFGTIEVLAGAGWTFDGTNTISSSSGYANGLYVGAGASVTNAGTLMLGRPSIGPSDGMYLAAGARFTNTGSVLTTSDYINSVLLSDGGQVTNGGTSALIESALYGIAAIGGAGTVDNQGTIIGTKDSGVLLALGGTVVNAGTGALIEGYAGVNVTFGAASTIFNQGTILSLASSGFYLADVFGVYLQPGGLVTNSGPKALISGGVELAAAGTVSNTGTILGGRYPAIGVYLEAGGTITNDAKGALIDGVTGVRLGTGAGTVVNFGTIASTSGTSGGTAISFGTSRDVLVDEAGSRLIGTIASDGGTLELAGKDGVVTGFGTNFAGFSTVDVLAGASWTLDGTNTLAAGRTFTLASGAALADSGVLTLDGVTDLAGTVLGVGTLTLAGTALLKPGVALTVAHLAISGGTTTLDTALAYAGGFVQSAGTLALGGGTLSLTGAASFKGGAVAGSGFLATHKTAALTALTLSHGAIWRDFGTVTATGALTLGNAGGGMGSLTVEAGGIFDLIQNLGIALAAGGKGGVTNAGLLEKTAGTATSTIAPAIANTGAIKVTAGTLNLAGAVTGAGKDIIGAAGTLKFDGAVAAGQTVSFAGTTGGDLALDDPSGTSLGFAGAITGFSGADRLDLLSFAFTGKPKLAWTQSGAKGTLTVTDGTDVARITLFGQYALAGFHDVSDGHGGTFITYTPPAQVVALANVHH